MIQCSGRAGVQTQAGRAFISVPRSHSGRAGGHCSTEGRSGVVLDHADSNWGLQGSLLLSCRHSFLHEVSLTHALHPRCHRGAAGTRVTAPAPHLQCAFLPEKLGESRPGNSEPGLDFPSLLYAEKDGKRCLVPSMMRGHSWHTQAPAKGQALCPPRSRSHPA